MQAFRRWGTAVAILAATTTACGHSDSSATSGAPQSAADSSAADAATRACTPASAPNSVWLEAVTPDGHYLVGTTDAATAATPASTHLFYGTPEHMAEAHVVPEKAIIGCAAYQSTFVVDDESY